VLLFSDDPPAGLQVLSAPEGQAASMMQAACCFGWSCLALMKNPKRCASTCKIPCKNLKTSWHGLAARLAFVNFTRSISFSCAWLPQETNGRERDGVPSAPFHSRFTLNASQTTCAGTQYLTKLISFVHHSLNMMILRQVGKCKCPVT
jgi:hypothetical protein